MLKKLALKKSVATSAAIISATITGYYKRAYSDSCTGSAPTYVCNASITEGASFTADETSVTTSGDLFNITAGSGEAGVSIIAKGALSFDDTTDDSTSSSITSTAENSDNIGIKITAEDSSTTSGSISIKSDSTITGHHQGIKVVNSGTGDIDINSSGDVTGGTSEGIYAKASIVSADLSITAANVTGDERGIKVKNLGVGYTAINSSAGTVSGLSNAGIYAKTSTSGTGLSITTAAVTGGSNGIFARSYGGETTTINSSGTVTGETFDGINAQNSTLSTGLSITTAAVTGSRTGIAAQNHGSGTTAINSSDGAVTGATSYGIYTKTSTSGTDLSITTAAVTGNNDGIRAYNNGSGATTIDSSDGNVTGNVSRGIHTISSGTNLSITTADVTGGTSGINAENSGSGTTTINSSAGDVTGTDGDGILASTSGTDLSITTAAITGSSSGILALNNGSGTTTIDSSDGNVTGNVSRGIYTYTSGTDISITTADVTGGTSGINAENFGSGTTTINSSAGNVTGNASHGINATSSSSTAGVSITTAAVTGSTTGISVESDGSGTTNININGNITGTSSSGIYSKSKAGSRIEISSGVDVTGATGIKIKNTDDLGSIITIDGSTSESSVTGTGGTAISFDDGDDTLNLVGDVNIDGEVNGENGSDTISFTDSTTTITNGGFNSFETISFIGDNDIIGDIDLTNIANIVANGELTIANLTLGDGNALSGNGTLIGTLTANSGATIAPGNSIGLIEVVGDASFNNGSIFEVEVEGILADKLTATGDITIDDGATLNITSTNLGSISANILEAGGKITGKFGTVTNDNDNITLVYTPNNKTVALINFNTKIVDTQLQSSLDSSLLFNDNLTSQIASDAFTKGRSFWTRSLYRNRNLDSNGSLNGFVQNSHGLALGAQFDVGDYYKLGFSLAKVSSRINLDQGNGSRYGESIFTSVYGTYYGDITSESKFFTSLSLGFGYHDNENNRLVINSSSSSYARSNSKDTDLSATLQAGLKFNLNEWSLTPKVSASYVQTNGGGFNEKNGGNAAVNINDFTFSTIKTRESVRFEKESTMQVFNNINISPYFEVGLAQETSLGNRNISGSFITKTNFNTTLNEHSNNFATASVGINANITKAVSAFINYEGSHSKNEKRSDAQAGIKVKF